MRFFCRIWWRRGPHERRRESEWRLWELASQQREHGRRQARRSVSKRWQTGKGPRTTSHFATYHGAKKWLPHQIFVMRVMSVMSSMFSEICCHVGIFGCMDDGSRPHVLVKPAQYDHRINNGPFWVENTSNKTQIEIERASWFCRHHTYLYARRRTSFSCAHHSAQVTHWSALFQCCHIDIGSR